VDQQTASGAATGTAQTRFIHPDHLGSTNVVTNASGTVVQTLDYYPYGARRVSASTGGADSGRKYIGQFADQSNLDYLNARYYDSARGQFLSEDPVFWGNAKDQLLNNPQTLNTYSYANDNPITGKDPQGNATYVYSNQAVVWGDDTWNKGTYLQANDNAMLQVDAAHMQSEAGSAMGWADFANLNWKIINGISMMQGLRPSEDVSTSFSVTNW